MAKSPWNWSGKSEKGLWRKGFAKEPSLKYRVRTDPGKVWKVLEFNVDIFKASKSLENDLRY